MKIEWHIEKHDVEAVRTLLLQMGDHPFVARRRRINVENPPKHVSRDQFWQAMIACLLTTQQRSGPNSPVSRLRKTSPFPLVLDVCRTHDDIGTFVTSVLTDFRGIRRGPTIGRHVQENLEWLDAGGWKSLSERIKPLLSKRSPKVESEAATFVAKHLKGFGPKQSRNFWQQLGLTMWEIPIDSRITRWLNQHKFPLRLSAKALGDPNYYKFVSTGLQGLCRESDTFPCVLDAAIFASFDSLTPVGGSA